MSKVKGMFLRGRMWWLRYTPAPGEKQVREPLGTEHAEVASVLALQKLHQAPLERGGDYDGDVERYLKDMGDTKGWSREAVKNRRYSLNEFARLADVSAIEEISLPRIEAWLKILNGDEKKKLPALVKPETAKTYVMRVRAFCRWLVRKNRLRENPAVKIEFGKSVKKWRKDFQPAAVVKMLIDGAPDDDLRFELYCGLHAGLRKQEIVEARPQWFRLGIAAPQSGKQRRGCIAIEETPTFKPKDRDERIVPLSSEFEEFLRGYLAKLPADAEFVLRPEKKHRKHRYRYDFRKPFAEYMKAQGVKLTPHDMRRSFVSNKLIENGSLLAKLSKWTGDDIKTMMDHYAWLLADDDDIDVAV